MLTTPVLQSLLSIGAEEITLRQWLMNSLIQARTMHSRKGNKGLAEECNKDIEKIRKRIKILSRNQQHIKSAIKDNKISDHIEFMTYGDLYE